MRRACAAAIIGSGRAFRIYKTLWYVGIFDTAEPYNSEKTADYRVSIMVWFIIVANEQASPDADSNAFDGKGADPETTVSVRKESSSTLVPWIQE